MRAWMLQLWLLAMAVLGTLAVVLVPPELLMILVGAGGFLMVCFGWILMLQYRAVQLVGGWFGAAVGWLVPAPHVWAKRIEIGVLERLTVSLLALELGALTHIIIKTH